MYDYSCLFHYGDARIGSSGLVYFQTTDQFESWFKNSEQIRWAVLVKNDTGEVTSTLNRPISKYGS
jgi:hypothetical protein